MSELLKITGTGQLSVGDKIRLISKDGTKQNATVRLTLDSGTPLEEIVINKTRNHYFITGMLIDGTSWVKECFKVSRPSTSEAKE